MNLDRLIVLDILDVSRMGDTPSYLKSKRPKTSRFGWSFTLALGLITVCALAFSVKAATYTPENLKTCKGVNDLGRTIMKARQDKLPMMDLMEIDTGEMNPLVQLMVTAAFKEPLYQSAEFQENATTEFANKWYAICLKARSE